MARFLVLFCILQASLFVIELTPIAQENFVTPFTNLLVLISVGVISPFDAGAISNGIYLYDIPSEFAMSIEAGCNAIEASIVLLAAILAFPATWRSKLVGILCGLLSLHVVNILRIVSLFYIGQWDMKIFEWAHLYIWQALIMLDVFIVFLFWLRYVIRGGSNTSAFGRAA